MAKKKAKTPLYLFKLYRHAEYYAPDEGSPAHYSLQIFHEYKWVGTYRKETMQAVLDAVRADKKAEHFEIVGNSYLDYLMPQNALEKAMLDEILELRRIVSVNVQLGDLERMGYGPDAAQSVLTRCEDHKVDTDE